MKMQKLYQDIQAALLGMSVLALTACGGDNADQASTALQGNATEQTATIATEPAVINFAVKFPASEASAAWVGDASSVVVNFYATDAANWDEVQSLHGTWQACNEFDGETSACDEVAATSLKGGKVSSITLTPDEATGYLNLEPGSYRVEAGFLDADNHLRETSVSYATFPSGAHTVRLTGLSAIWTLDTPVALVLMSSSAAADVEADWDPEVDGDQSPAQAMGLVDGALTSFKLPTAATLELNDVFADEFGAEASMQAGLMTVTAPTEDAANRTYFVPTLAVTTVASDVTEATGSWNSSTSVAYDASYDGEGAVLSEVFTSSTHPAFLRQSYDGSSNTSSLTLGGRSVHVGRTYISSSTAAVLNSSGSGAELLLGVPSTGSAEPAYQLTSLSSDSARYWSDGGFVASPGMTVATINTELTPGSSWLDLFLSLQGQANSISGGTSISGYLIEHVYKYETTQVTASYEEAPTPVLYLDASLNAIAQAAGLTASAAADEVCQSYSNETETSFSNQYRWDETNQRWVAGTFNSLLLEGGIMTDLDSRIANLREDQAAYAPGAANENADVYAAYSSVINEFDVDYRNMVLTMADLNDDGVASLFEDGAYILENVEPSCRVDEETVDGLVYFRLTCREITPVTTVASEITSISGNICVQPFTATASALE